MVAVKVLPDWPTSTLGIFLVGVVCWGTAILMRNYMSDRWRHCVIACDEFLGKPVDVGLHHCRCVIPGGAIIELRDVRRRVEPAPATSVHQH